MYNADKHTYLSVSLSHKRWSLMACR